MKRIVLLNVEKIYNDVFNIVKNSDIAGELARYFLLEHITYQGLKMDNKAIQIVLAVSIAYQIPLTDMLFSRKPKKTEPKHLAIYLVSQLGYEPTKVAEMFGVHRTSVYHAVKKTTGYLELNDAITSKSLEKIKLFIPWVKKHLN